MGESVALLLNFEIARFWDGGASKSLVEVEQEWG